MEQADNQVPVKVFNDSTAFDRLPHETLADLQQAISTDSTRTRSSGSSSIPSSSGHSPPGSPSRSFLQMAMTPRCVLCSKHYEVGEAVTHSSNPQCHHEYHELCLKKHWTSVSKKQTTSDKCPVCKEAYLMTDEVAPSTRFSTHTNLESPDRNETPSNQKDSAVPEPPGREM